MFKAVFFVLAFSLVSCPALAEEGRASRAPVEALIPVVAGPDIVRVSSGTAAIAARETAGPDTFVIYGGPDRGTEGKFQLDNGVTADWGGGNGLPGGYGGGPGAWTPVDMTEEPVYWHQSMFNAENLNSNGAGNHALWSGIAPGDPLGAGYARLPGYGNNWFDVAMYTSEPVADPSLGQTVDLEFFFNYDLWDITWDFFSVQYDSAGVWTTVMEVTGFNRDEDNIFHAPGVQFSAEQEAPIVYAGNDYGGLNNDRIRIRFLITSDGGWSDEDIGGGVAGAAQVDDVTLTTSQGTFTEDFEVAGPYLFDPSALDIAGDFADVYARLTDLDPCRDNNTPVIGFIDYGQEVRNGPDGYGHTTTGGSKTPGVEYGIPGNWVVNYTGGLSMGLFPLQNEIWSPEITWDLPGPADDDVSIAGAKLTFDVWRDLPLLSGIFYTWSVRSDGGSGYGEWKDRNYVYFSTNGLQSWLPHSEDVTDLLKPFPESTPQKVQIALGVYDYADIFQFPGTEATPSPVFDNVRLSRYRLPGPTIVARTIDLAQDAFPISGTLDVSTQGGRDAMDIPFSMARDVNTGEQMNVPGDSIVVDVDALIPGTTLVDVRMVWALQTNPVFEDAIRAAPARDKDENVVAGASGTVWSGEVVGENKIDPLGEPDFSRFFFDLPDVDVMYPGDVLHYYIRAEDSDGRVSTLPHDISWFGDFAPDAQYNRTFRVRCLPTLMDTAGTQPPILVYNGFGRRGGEEEWYWAFRQLLGAEGIDYDSYTVMGPTSNKSNGIGSAGAHGATVAQLTGYETILGFFGDLSSTLSNGSNAGAGNNKSDDLGLLGQWHALAGPRNVAWFGDAFASGLENNSAEGASYVASILGVDVFGPDVSPSIGGQTAPVVVPNSGVPYFDTEFAAYGGCYDIKSFDRILPLTGAEAGHWFTDVSGAPIVDLSGGAASVVHALPNGFAITFPYDPIAIQDVSARAVDLSARALLLNEVLGVFDGAFPTPPVAVPEVQRVELSVAPNPFNPVTTVRFTARPGSKGSVKVFNLRGELVKVLHSGEFQSTEFRWGGHDDGGAAVGSGVYLIQAVSDGETQTVKVALVK